MSKRITFTDLQLKYLSMVLKAKIEEAATTRLYPEHTSIANSELHVLQNKIDEARFKESPNED